jgi:hypothetical protein
MPPHLFDRPDFPYRVSTKLNRDALLHCIANTSKCNQSCPSSGIGARYDRYRRFSPQSSTQNSTVSTVTAGQSGYALFAESPNN